MTDSIRILPPGFQVTNASGSVQSGAVLKFYNSTVAGSTRTVYSDSGLSTSLGVTVTCNSSGRPAASGGAGAEILIYTGTTPYAVKAETSTGETLWSFDNITGALDTSDFSAVVATPATPVISKTTDYTVLSTDQAKIINANCTGGTFTVTLPSAVSVGDGWFITIKHNGTANQVKISAVSSQTIDDAVGRVLSYENESLTLCSDGANWNITSHTRQINSNTSNVFFIADRIATDPVSPTAGARYIVTGTPTGNWSAYSQHDIAESDGQGGWIRVSPVAGWVAYVVDENKMYAFNGSAWVDQTPLPRGYIDGCIVSNSTGDATNDIDVAAGVCRDSTNAFNISISAVTKQLDADWAAGTTAGMRYSGAAISNTTYHIFAIAKVDGTSDIFAYTGLDPTSVLPTGYVYFRRIRSILRVGGAIQLEVQIGDYIRRKVPSIDLAGVSGNASAQTNTLPTVPTGIVVRVDLNVRMGTNGGYVVFFAVGDTYPQPSTTSAALATVGDGSASPMGFASVWTNTSAQIGARTNSNPIVYSAAVLGYLDTRGKS